MAYIKGKQPGGETLDYSDGITDNGDTIIGNAGNDHIYAGKGDDVIKGGGGADYIDGNLGFDTVDYETSGSGVNVNLQSNHGHGGDAEGDILIDIEGVVGSAFDDTIKGDSKDNKLYGMGGNDTLKGGGGADLLEGGAGNDILEIDGKEDKAHGGDGTDTLVLNSHTGLTVNLSNGSVTDNVDGLGWDGKYSHYLDVPDYYHPAPGTVLAVDDIENIIGSSYDDELIGDWANNFIAGGNGNDLVSGRGGDDNVSGGNGNDVLFGGLGADLLTGGQGADIFVFTRGDESVVVNGKPQDFITDFEQGVDKIDLVAVMSNQPAGNLLTLDNQLIGGKNYSIVGLDANHNGQFDDGEFAVAVQMAPGSVLHLNDYILS